MVNKARVTVVITAKTYELWQLIWGEGWYWSLTNVYLVDRSCISCHISPIGPGPVSANTPNVGLLLGHRR